VVVALTNFFNRSYLMRKNVLALSIATMIGGLGLSGLASATVIPGTGGAPTALVLGTTNATGFELSQGGVGHQLIVPYFTAQDGNMTVFHVVNTDTVNGKVMKVRFRGAANSDDILDFYVLLSPGDVWTGAVTANSSGFAQLTTTDTSCTYPKIASGVPQAFVPNRLNPAWSTAVQAENTREGYIEMFVAADIPNTAQYSATDVGAGAVQSNLYKAIKHVAGTPPCTQAALDVALLNDITVEATAAGRGMATPTAGLTGDWYIINVPKSTTFSGAATSILATSAPGVGGRGNYVVFPQRDLALATPENFTADPSLVSAGLAFRTKDASGVGTVPTVAPVITAAFYDVPDLSTPYYLAPTPANARTTAGALTAALAVKTTTNQYATDASISAKTDWVFSMPTRRYSVAYDYSKTTTASTEARVFSIVPPAAANNQYFYSGNTSVETGKTQICVSASGQSFFDREETGATSGPVFSPGSVTTTRLCGETSVLAFADSGVSSLGATVARTTVTSGIFQNGYGVVSTIDATTGLGLPILGSSFMKLTNPSASPGVSGNYGITWPHRFTK
jgi:hypothetical protein